MNKEQIEAQIQEHATAITQATAERDKLIAETNERITQINTEMLRREGAIMALRSVADAPDNVVPLGGDEIAKERKRGRPRT